jgi:hypothetical protein
VQDARLAVTSMDSGAEAVHSDFRSIGVLALVCFETFSPDWPIGNCALAKQYEAFIQIIVLTTMLHGAGGGDRTHTPCGTGF